MLLYYDVNNLVFLLRLFVDRISRISKRTRLDTTGWRSFTWNSSRNRTLIILSNDIFTNKIHPNERDG